MTIPITMSKTGRRSFFGPLAKAFSLIELLVVIAVIILLVGLSVPAFQALTQSGIVTTGAQGLVDELSSARQTATAKNLRVEVRFYEMEVPLFPSVEFRAYRSFESGPDGTLRPLGPLRRLPTGLIMIRSDLHSSLLGSENEIVVNTVNPDPERTSGTKVFSFLSDGSTDLDPDLPWFITLLEEKKVPAVIPGSGPPTKNWAVVRVDPSNGRTSVHRP